MEEHGEREEGIALEGRIEELEASMLQERSP